MYHRLTKCSAGLVAHEQVCIVRCCEYSCGDVKFPHFALVEKTKSAECCCSSGSDKFGIANEKLNVDQYGIAN